MADLPPAPDPESDPSDDAGTPRWVYVFAITALVLILLFALLHLSSGGFRGHLPS